MKRILSLIVPLFCVFPLFAGKGPQLKVASWELGASGFRASIVRNGTADSQRLWCNSAVAVADAILDADCDIVCIQAVCDSIAGRLEGTESLMDMIQRRGGDYRWLVLSNTNPNYPLEGLLLNGTGVIWRDSRFELRDYGISWLGGLYDKPGRSKGLKYGSGNPAVVWVRLYDRFSSKEIVAASANTNGPTQYDKGQKVIYHEINVANCRNLISLMKNEIVPKGTASVICLNSHNATSHDGYKELNSSVWFDAFDHLNENGMLSQDDLKVQHTMNSADEKKLEGGRPDHILVDGAEILSYKVLRKKYRTADGSLHYPSLHFPIVSEIIL